MGGRGGHHLRWRLCGSSGCEATDTMNQCFGSGLSGNTQRVVEKGALDLPVHSRKCWVL